MLAHRWNGLFLAFFLAVMGLSGAVIAWNDPLERVFAPRLFVLPAHRPAQPMLDAESLREIAARTKPDAQVNSLELMREPDVPAQFLLEPRAGQPPLADDTLFIDPYSGRVLGARMTGDLGQGLQNLIPFIYLLHTDLALGEWGALFLGVVALLWTLDCFVGLYLTFPVAKRSPASSWPARWQRSWLVRAGRGLARLNYDLHRAAGLWLWLMLLLFAWSAVSFNLPAVYKPVMRALGAEAEPAPVASQCGAQASQPLDWREAHRRAGAVMTAEGQRLGFRVVSERFLNYDPATCTLVYRVKSTRDLGRLGNTQITIARDGAVVLARVLPTGTTAADTFTTWIGNLHEAQLGGLWFRILVCCTGLAVAGLGMTGVIIYCKKRKRGARAPETQLAVQPIRPILEPP